jgi:hypothetical protein
MANITNYFSIIRKLDDADNNNEIKNIHISISCTNIENDIFIRNENNLFIGVYNQYYLLKNIKLDIEKLLLCKYKNSEYEVIDFNITEIFDFNVTEICGRKFTISLKLTDKIMTFEYNIKDAIALFGLNVLTTIDDNSNITKSETFYLHFNIKVQIILKSHIISTSISENYKCMKCFNVPVKKMLSIV